MSLHTVTIIVGALLVAGGVAQIAYAAWRQRHPRALAEGEVTAHLYRPRLGLEVVPCSQRESRARGIDLLAEDDA